VQINLVDGRQPDMEKGYICHHTEGRLGGCQCLCYNNHLEHLWETHAGTIDCKKDVYGEDSCLVGGPSCLDTPDTTGIPTGQCSWPVAEAQANCEGWLDCKAIVCVDGSAYCQARSEYAAGSYVNTSVTSYVLVGRTIAPEHLFSQAPFVSGDTIKIQTKGGGVLSNAPNGLVEVVYQPTGDSTVVISDADVSMSTVVYLGVAGIEGAINFMHSGECMVMTGGQVTRQAGTWCGATDASNLDQNSEVGLWKAVAVDDSYFEIRHNPYTENTGNPKCLTVIGNTGLGIADCINSDGQQYYFSWF